MKSVKSKKQIRKTKSKRQIRKSKKQIKKSKKQIRKTKTRRRQKGGTDVTKETLRVLPDHVLAEYYKNPDEDPSPITIYTNSIKTQVQKASAEKNLEFFKNLADWEEARKDKIIAKIRKDTKDICIPCEIPGNKSLLITEKYENSISEGVCGLFPVIELSQIELGTIYNYILYRENMVEGQPFRIILSKLYQSPEIATKHNCLINRIPGNPIIIGAGELVLDDAGNLNYNCTSSLWFLNVFGQLFPTPKPRGLIEINGMIREFYESEYIKYKLAILFDTDPKYIEGGLTGVTSTLDFKQLCELPERDNYCLKLVDKDSCESIRECPPDGPSVVDYCTSEGAVCQR